MFHLAHFTFGWVTTTPAVTPGGGPVEANYLVLVDPAGRHDVYSMVVAGFKNPVVSVLYIVAMVFLYVHLSHGIGSVFQTLGLNTPRTQPFVTGLSRTLAWCSRSATLPSSSWCGSGKSRKSTDRWVGP